jgi:hypothetical protein
MSINVDELNDFEIRNYNGKNLAINIEDLRFIQSKANLTLTKSFYDVNTNLRFVYLSNANVLVLDESNPVTKKNATSYRILIATPPLVNFEFGLAFVKSDETPAPAAIKLRDVLQNVGYNGPLVTKLKQIDMYYLNLPVTEALSKPAASFMYNIDLGLVTLAANIARPLPVNTTILPSPDILIGDSVGSIFIKTPGWFLFTGAWCVNQNFGYQMTSLVINGVNVGKNIRHNWEPKATDANLPNSFHFTYIDKITEAQIRAGPSGIHASVGILCYTSEEVGFAGGAVNFLDVAMI